MKNFKTVLLLMLLFACLTSKAQVSATAKRYIPVDPKTNCQLRYHYFPNLYAYFDNLNNVYYFQLNGEWQTAPELPKNYGGYSLFNNGRIAITNFDDENPQQFIKIHKKLYPYNSKGRHSNATASTE